MKNPERLIIEHPTEPLVVMVPVAVLRPLWAHIVCGCIAHHVPTDLWLALVCVENGMYSSRHGGAFRVFPDRVACNLAMGPDQATMAAIRVSIRHLATQLGTFPSIEFALMAYHTHPEWVLDDSGFVTDSRLAIDFVDAVLATWRWLCCHRPWRVWGSAGGATIGRDML